MHFCIWTHKQLNNFFFCFVLLSKNVFVTEDSQSSRSFAFSSIFHTFLLIKRATVLIMYLFIRCPQSTFGLVIFEMDNLVTLDNLHHCGSSVIYFLTLTLKQPFNLHSKWTKLSILEFHMLVNLSLRALILPDWFNAF